MVFFLFKPKTGICSTRISLPLSRIGGDQRGLLRCPFICRWHGAYACLCPYSSGDESYAWRLAGAVNVMAGPGTLVQDTTVLDYWSNVVLELIVIQLSSGCTYIFMVYLSAYSCSIVDLIYL